MNIKILGGGCCNCDKLTSNTKEALNQLNIEATIEKVQDFAKIMEYGVMRTPAFVINEKVEVFGRVPKVDEIKDILNMAQK
jgi:small redox-active disulfide protein 2